MTDAPKQSAPERIWLSTTPEGGLEDVWWPTAEEGDIEYLRADLLTTVRQEEQRNFINNIAAMLGADDVETFTALVMKAKQSPDLNSETRSALKSEVEISRETWEVAIGAVAVLPRIKGTMNFARGYEEGVGDALRTLEVAAAAAAKEGK